MSTQLVQLIDLEIRKLMIAREALVGSGQQSQAAGEQEPITAAALLNGVDTKDFPLFPDTNDNHHRQAAPVVQKRKGGGMSPEGRARVAAAQKLRWANIAKKKKGSRAAA